MRLNLFSGEDLVTLSLEAVNFKRHDRPAQIRFNVVDADPVKHSANQSSMCSSSSLIGSPSAVRILNSADALNSSNSNSAGALKRFAMLRLRRSSGRSVGDSVAVVALATLISLLLANICVIYGARLYNDSCCREALIRAAQAAIKGQNSQAIRREALAGLASCHPVGFSEPSQFTEFDDQRVQGWRQLRVQTHTLAHIPVPMLVIDEEYRSGAPLSITSTYVAQIKGPTP